MVQGRLENGAVVNVYCGVQPYHGSGHRLEIYGKEGALTMIGGGEGGQELRRKLMGGHKDDKALQELSVPEKFKWVPEALRSGPEYDVGQMWVKFAEGIRTGAPINPDFDHAVRRHRTLDAIVRASQTGQRQKIA
jgi:predicted dehydrogenase